VLVSSMCIGSGSVFVLFYDYFILLIIGTVFVASMGAAAIFVNERVVS
jgi:hypothetical protein